MSYGGMSKKEQQEVKKEVNKARDAGRSREGNKAAYKVFCETANKIDEVMKFENDFRQFYGPKGMEIITNAYKVVKAQSEEIFRGRKKTPTQQDRETVQRALNVLQDVLLMKPIVPLIRDLSIYFARMTANWDRAICKCQPIRRKCMVIDELARAQLSLMTAIEVMRELVNRGQRHLQYTPPAFEISRALLELDDE